MKIKADYIKMVIPKSIKVKGEKKKKEVWEIEEVLSYEGFGILRLRNSYSVTILVGNKMGMSLGRGNLYLCWVLISILNKFYPKVNELLSSNDEEKILDASKMAMSARNATQAITGGFIG